MKSLADILCLGLVVPVLAVFRTACLFSSSERVFPGFSQFISLFPGLSGTYLRRAFYRHVLPMVGRDVWISFGTVFSHPTAEIGHRVYVGVGCMLGDVTLKDDVLIGSHVSVINGNRQHGTERLDVPVREQPGEYPRITVGRDTWIGDRAVVMADLGSHCVIGAGSVVTKPVPNFGIAVGNPARVLRYRGQPQPSTLEQSGAGP
ncbi:MAG: acyltransferase [Planctomycetaceae bacterium]|nr:acyltransferase [Planctomycetaceae bacterium]